MKSMPRICKSPFSEEPYRPVYSAQGPLNSILCTGEILQGTLHYNLGDGRPGFLSCDVASLVMWYRYLLTCLLGV
jgi:hypothetical protein